MDIPLGEQQMGHWAGKILALKPTFTLSPFPPWGTVQRDVLIKCLYLVLITLSKTLGIS